VPTSNYHSTTQSESPPPPNGHCGIFGRYGQRAIDAFLRHRGDPISYDQDSDSEGRDQDNTPPPSANGNGVAPNGHSNGKVPKGSTRPARFPSRLEWVLESFDDAHRVGEGYMASCPFHDDSIASLRISEGEDGRVLVHCHAGCPTDEVLALVGMSLKDLMPGTPYPVAHYDYKDAEGKLLYQVVRYQPKSFRMRQPNPEGTGGWVWKLPEVRVLYRLPDILRRPDDYVYLVEGEKDADRLSALGFLATTTVNGARNPWRSGYTEPLRGRKVVLVPDNDPSGYEYILKAGRALQFTASLVLLELPGLKPKGDVSDWLDAGGTAKQLRELTAAAPPYDPAEKSPAADSKSLSRVNRVKSGAYPTFDPLTEQGLTTKSGKSGGFGALERYPVEVWPAKVQEFLEAVANALPCPVDLPGTLMLPVLGSCIGLKFRVRIKEGWEESPLIWSAVIADVGEYKTPALNMATEPLRARQKQLSTKHKEEKEAYLALPKAERQEKPPPVLKQVLTTDTTMEGLKKILDTNPDGICFPADELIGWLRSHGQYKNGGGNDRQNWLSIWSGVQVVSNRAGQLEALIIDNPFVGISGAFQPGMVPEIIEEGATDGLAARFMISWPEFVKREWDRKAVVGKVVADNYRLVCNNLWDMTGSKEPVDFSPAAAQQWDGWMRGHIRQSPPPALKGVWSKMGGYCARLALILFLSRKACGEVPESVKQIDAASVRGAVSLVNYFKSHAQRVYEHSASLSDTTRIGEAMKWVRKQWAQGREVSSTLVTRSGVCRCRKAEEADELLHDLADLQHGVLREGPRGGLFLDPTDKEETS
jgi:hypothetical protein